MDLVDWLQEAVSGPMRFRFVVQPAVAVLLAVRDGVADARAGNAPFFYRLITRQLERGPLLRSARSTLTVPLLVAFALDSVAQLVIRGRWAFVDAVEVGILLMGVPYVLVRGLACRVQRRRRPRHA